MRRTRWRQVASSTQGGSAYCERAGEGGGGGGKVEACVYLSVFLCICVYLCVSVCICVYLYLCVFVCRVRMFFNSSNEHARIVMCFVPDLSFVLKNA
jgi:hypothetical protein